MFPLAALPVVSFLLVGSPEYLPQYPEKGCPAGWVGKGGYCQKMNRSTPNAFPSYGNICPPTTYSDGYNCIKMKEHRK